MYFLLQMNFDELLDVTGGFGLYQVKLMLVVFLLCINSAIITMNSVFFAGAADHWCKIPELAALNLTQDQEKNMSIPLETRDGRIQYSQCLRYNINYSQLVDSHGDNIWPPEQSLMSVAQTLPCDQGWVYDTSQYSSTILMEVCGKQNHPSKYNSSLTLQFQAAIVIIFICKIYVNAII